MFRIAINSFVRPSFKSFFLLSLIMLLAVVAMPSHASAWKFPGKFRAVHFWQPWINTNPEGEKGAWLEYEIAELDLGRADSELKMISQQGFNAVVFWVNWGDIISSVNYVDSDPSSGEMTYTVNNAYVAKLQEFLLMAKHYGLSVVLTPVTGINPALYHDDGKTLSTRVCSSYFSVYYNTVTSGSCVWAQDRREAVFKDSNMFNAYNAFMRELSFAVSGSENVFGFIIPWETDNALKGDITVSQIKSLAGSLKVYDKAKSVSYYPRPDDPDDMYYITGTDFVSLGWYGSGDGAMLSIANDISHVLEKSASAQPAGYPPMKAFVYEFGYDAHVICENFDASSDGCATGGYTNHVASAEQPVAGWNTRGEMWQDIFVGFESSTLEDRGVVSKLEANPNLLGYAYWGLYDVGPYSPLCETESAGSDHFYYDVTGYGLIKLVPTAASKAATTCQEFLDDNVAGFTEQPREAWYTFGRILKSPQIDSAGLGCQGNQCMWIKGQRFAGQFEDASLFPNYCHVDFYTPDWSAPGFIMSVTPDHCDDESITLTIPPSILSSYKAVNINVTNKYGVWSSPKLINLVAPPASP